MLLHLMLAVLAVYLVLTALYLLAVSIAACFHRPKRIADSPPLRIAMVIPAHDEEGLIASAVANALALEYPADRFTVFVVADNCSDGTAVLAEQAGATVWVRRDAARPGKHYALDWLLREHADRLREYDVISVTDADTVIDGQYLSEISAALSHPDVDAAQGYYGVANPDANWRTALTAAGFAFVNHTRCAGRNVLGGTAGYKGNGVALRSAVFTAQGFSAFSLVEDLEYGIRLLAEGFVVQYNPRARVFAQMPAGRMAAEHQRRRWEGGRAGTVRAVAPVLWRALLHGPQGAQGSNGESQDAGRAGRWACAEAVCDLAVPPLALLVILHGGLLLAGLFAGGVYAGVAAVCMAAAALCVVLALIQVRAPRRVWLSLVAAPLFVVWKLVLYARLAVHPPSREWRRTPREK
jgi:1,2-diacylglycerol 3-beta-glucosyltransferase